MDIGFTAFKLHAWGDAKRDIELSRALRRWTGPDADLMFDGSAGWDYVDALTVGKALQDEGFLWYEEPMREFYLGAYAKLCDKLDIPVLAAETSDGAHFNMASWIEAGALDMTRVSSFYKGGFTGAMKIAHMSESFGMRCQVHGMGLENAQICAAIRNNDYYEQLVMNTDQIAGLKDLGPLAIVDGNLTVNDEPGLGYRADTDALDALAISKIKVTERHF
jgi:L-alanine-DL-glutamate epimerase-like enolase superfamily enzyme